MKNLTTDSYITVKEALRKISATGKKGLVVVDKFNKILGTLSDGDLRKALLKGAKISDSIQDIFNRNPTYLFESEYTKEEVKQLFLENKFDIVPVVDPQKKVVGILVWDEVFRNVTNAEKMKLDASVVIMAGGKGTRLEPFTKVLPKPLLPIHEKPIIEHIIERFTLVGVNKFFLTVNYKSRILKAFFDELNTDYSVEFVEEQEPLGTAGSLRFLAGRFKRPFLLTNCDIIIDADYADLYAFHLNENYDITLVVSTKEHIIPYGTCHLNGDGHLDYISEKPQFHFLINTGLYVLNPTVLELIPKEKTYHITNLIDDAKKQGLRVGVYPIDDDDWIDIGQWAEYKKAVEKL